MLNKKKDSFVWIEKVELKKAYLFIYKVKVNINNFNRDSDEEYVDLAVEFEKKLNDENNQLIGAALTYDNPLYKINREITKEVKKFNYTLKMIEYLAINPKANNFIESIKDTKQFIENLVAQHISKQPDNTKIGICINHDLFTEAINLPFQIKEQIKPEIIWNSIEKTIQSKKKTEKLDIKDEHKIIVTFKIAQLNHGGTLHENISYSARKKREQREKARLKKQQLNETKAQLFSQSKNDQDTYIENSPHVLRVIITDNNCFMRALLLALEYVNNDPNRFKYQNEKTEEFDTMVNSKLKECGLDKNKKVGLKQIKTIQN